MKKNILFIVNPVSGGKKKESFPNDVDRYLNRDLFSAHILFTSFAGHAGQAAQQALETNDIIVAVGGDGTINEIASVVEGTGKLLGIVPWGSGNGLARSLGIPLLQKNALQRLNALNTVCIDSAVMNGHKFFNMGGIGFDAHISARFADHKTRGFKGYVGTTFREIASYLPHRYRIEIDGKMHEREAFMLSIANSSQFGNNAHISPRASLTDGLLDICIIKPFPLYLLPVMGYHMFSKTAHHSGYVEIIRGKQVRILRDAPGPVHLDGEYMLMGNEIHISIKPLSLNVLA